MLVEKLRCGSCGTEVHGHYEPCQVCSLDLESRRLFDLFLRARGNLKDVQRALKVSYPTVRQRIEAMFQKLELGKPGPDPMEILGRVRRGELSVEQAERLLRGETA
jgi:hypothetical protein